MLTKKKITKIKNKFLAALVFASLFCFVVNAGISSVHAVSHDINHAKDLHHCTICSVSNLQSQFLTFANPNFVAAIFFLIFALRNFNRVKLSYLLSSYNSQAPPARS
jgi:hypothetical protein